MPAYKTTKTEPECSSPMRPHQWIFAEGNTDECTACRHLKHYRKDGAVKNYSVRVADEESVADESE